MSDTAPVWAPGVPDDVAFRRVLSHFATGLVIVTSIGDETDARPVGMTCQSFASVSLDPPLVGFYVSQESRSWPLIEAAGRFCVSVLADHQENLARIFAMRGADKFKDVGTYPSPNGAPVIAGALAWIDCDVETTFAAGDHIGVLGRVTSLQHADNAKPLLYFRGGYGVFES